MNGVIFMRLYLDAETNFTNRDDLSIDYIEVQLKNGETVSLNWDESDFGIEDGVFSARYKGVYFDEDYANGRIEELLGMKVTDVGFYTESNKPLDFIITNMLFEDGEAELSVAYPYAVIRGESVPIEQLNTKIEYLYRDASNYKVYNECVVKGIVTAEQRKEIVDCLNEGEYFIPSQVGLPEKRFDDWTTVLMAPYDGEKQRRLCDSRRRFTLARCRGSIGHPTARPAGLENSRSGT